MITLNFKNNIINYKYFPVILLAVVNLLVAYFFIKKPFTPSSDYFTYVSGVDYVLGHSGNTGVFISGFNRL